VIKGLKNDCSNIEVCAIYYMCVRKYNLLQYDREAERILHVGVTLIKNL